MTAKPGLSLTKEWLHQKYWSEGLDLVQIGNLLDRDPKSVHRWMRKLEVPTRPRGSNAKVLFRKGEPSRFKGHHHTTENRKRFREARLRDGHVPYLKDGKHHLKGKRGAETPNWRGGVTPERQAFNESRAWKAASAATWRRASATCERCSTTYAVAPSGSKPFHVHHIVSFAVKALRCELANLVLLCAPCHRFVHSKANTKGEFLP
jgi:hypothetical protein